MSVRLLVIVPLMLALISLGLFAADPAPKSLSIPLGDDPTVGKFWSKPGTGGSFKLVANAGSDGKRHGVELAFRGNGYRGAGFNWKGWYPADASDDLTPYSALTFEIRQVSNVANADLMVYLVDNVKRDTNMPVSKTVSLVADKLIPKLDGTWRTVTIPLSRFADESALKLDRIWGIDFANMDGGDLTYQIDSIRFIQDSKPLTKFAATPKTESRILVDASRELHPIADEIYGVAEMAPDLLKAYAIPLTRWGGNTSSRFNWKLNADNGANDWFFKNRGEGIRDEGDFGYLKALRDNQRIGASLYLTLPMLGYVAKDRRSYGFSVKKYGPQQKTEPYFPDVGNGIRLDGSLITNNDPADTSIAAPPAFISEAVTYLVDNAGNVKPTDSSPVGVRYWVLDNEPMLWNSTHRDVHPKPVTYDELWDRTLRYGEAIRKADPSAKVAGLCSWGWNDLFYSAADEGNDSFRTHADRLQHGDTPLAVWYLQQCAKYKQVQGKPLVDVLDIHWYPQGEVDGQSIYPGKGTDPKLCEKRIRSLREWWDPQHISESWIADTQGGEPVNLIPRMKRWIAEHNPGMELCIGEYNFGGSDNISGAIAQAEAFGIMAREQVNLAFFWAKPEGSQSAIWKLFRNYDDQGSRFGNRWLACRSNHAEIAIYATKRSTDQAITLVLVNRSLGSPSSTTIGLPGVKGAIRGYRVDQNAINTVTAVKDLPATMEQQLRLELPAASVTLVEIRGR